MKAKIHPKYMDCKVTCGCGETFTTRATKPEMNVEICSKCHPFFTGKQKLVDTAGRVEKFARRYAKFNAQSAGAAAQAATPVPALRGSAASAGGEEPAEPSATQPEPVAAAAPVQEPSSAPLRERSSAPLPEPPPAPSQS